MKAACRKGVRPFFLGALNEIYPNGILQAQADIL